MKTKISHVLVAAVIVTAISTGLNATGVFAIGSGSGGAVPSPSPTPTPAPASNSNTNTNTAPSNTNNEPDESRLDRSDATESSEASCTKDEWTCKDWSACTPEGTQTRTCSLTTDCEGIEAALPETEQACDHLQCNQDALRDRIECRLNLTPAGVARELEIQYLPEECRAKQDKAERKECVDLYRKYAACWSKPMGEARFACARQSLGLGPDVSKAAIDCKQLSGDAREQCISDLRDQVYYLIKFRFYDLEVRAEEMATAGLVDIDTLTDFVTLIVEKKIEFNAANNTAERRSIIIDVRQGWEAFIDEVVQAQANQL